MRPRRGGKVARRQLDGVHEESLHEAKAAEARERAERAAKRKEVDEENAESGSEDVLEEVYNEYVYVQEPRRRASGPPYKDEESERGGESHMRVRTAEHGGGHTKRASQQGAGCSMDCSNVGERETEHRPSSQADGARGRITKENTKKDEGIEEGSGGGDGGFTRGHDVGARLLPRQEQGKK